MGYPKIRVLVADDDFSLIGFLEALLEDEGFDVLVAHDGQEALDEAVATSPDLILLDVHMPVMGGWTCYRKLKQHHETAHTPVIMMSANGADAAAQADVGVECFLRKPFDIAELLSCVTRSIDLATS